MDDLTETIRTELAKGAYQMPGDRLPCETKAHQIAHAVEQHITEHGDGFHTFAELYDHRHALFAALATARPTMAWRSREHDDGTMFDGMFVAGMDLPNGTISYHLPLSWWDAFDGVDTFDRAPTWDGYTPANVVQRLRDWTTAEAADYAPTRWWRVIDPNGKLWCESSSEIENRKAARPGDQLQRLYKQERNVSEWRDET